MRRLLLLVGTVALVATSGCYTSRHVAGDELKGGVLNPYLWVTVPIDTIMFPWQYSKWRKDPTDQWVPWDVDKVREEYRTKPFEPVEISVR